MSYYLSLIFYTALIAAVCLCAYAAQRSEKKGWLWLAVLLLSLAAGLRAESVGVDTASYVRLIRYCATVDYAYVSREYLIYGMGAVLYRLSGGSMAVPLTVYALITNGLIFARFWDFRDRCSLTAVALFYCLYYYGSTMNGIRQFVAIAVVFFATRYLFSQRYVKFYLLMLLGCLFHYSTFVCCLLPVLSIGCRRRYPMRDFAVLSFSALTLLAIIPFCINTYASYADNATVSVGWINIVRAMVFFAVCLLGLRPIVLSGQEDADCLGRTLSSVLLCICMVGFLCSFISKVSRAGYYFRFFELLIYGMVLQERKIQLITRCLLASALLVLGIHCVTAYNSIIPYAFSF